MFYEKGFPPSTINSSLFVYFVFFFIHSAHDTFTFSSRKQVRAVVCLVAKPHSQVLSRGFLHSFCTRNLFSPRKQVCAAVSGRHAPQPRIISGCCYIFIILFVLLYRYISVCLGIWVLLESFMASMPLFEHETHKQDKLIPAGLASTSLSSLPVRRLLLITIYIIEYQYF